MKILFLILIALSVEIQTAFANRIDELKTDDDVAVFINSIDKKFHKKGAPPFEVKSTSEILKNCDYNKALGIRNWVKADFNNDGNTDLLVIGYWYNDFHSYVAIDMGSNKFKLIEIYYSPFNCEISDLYKTGNTSMLLFYTNKDNFDREHNPAYTPNPKDNPQADTLIYKFHDFVEYNKHPSTYDIDSIKFQSGECFGTCPAFSIVIDSIGKATYYAGKYSPKEGVFKTKISSKYLNEIYKVMGYINIKDLNNDYRVNWSDYPTCWIIIKFKDGTSKTIKDYGELGTFGLRKLYKLFFQLRDNQNWE